MFILLILISHWNNNYSKSAELKLREINLKLMFNLACFDNYLELANIYLKLGDLDNAKIVLDTISNHSRSFVGDTNFKYQYASTKLNYFMHSNQLDSVISTFKSREIQILNCSDLSKDIQNQLYAIIAYCMLGKKSLALQLFISLENYRIKLGDGCINNGTIGSINILGNYLKGDPESVARQLRELKALGLRVAVDDFGCGFSSLGSLNLLPFHRVKIDRAFVRELTPETAEDCIATMIVKLARSLGLEVTAEGVETESQAQLLQDMGCKEMQGFLYGKPMNAVSLEAWIRQQGD